MYTTEKLARFILAIDKEKIPEASFQAAVKCVLDVFGATSAGFEAATPTREFAMAVYSDHVVTTDAVCDNSGGEAAVLLAGRRCNMIGAAFANSAAASALDLDDGHRAAMGHPGAAVIPAAISVSEKIRVEIHDFLIAVILGYEIGVRIAKSRDHAGLSTLSTGRWSAYAVVACAGRLMGLTETHLAQALSVAGVLSPELSAAGYSAVMGNAAKEGIPWSVVTGLSACLMARNGFTGPLDILDNPDYFDAAGIMEDIDDVNPLPAYAIETVYFKPYACCRWIHAAIDAVLAMNIPDPEGITSIIVNTFERALRLSNETSPVTLEGAQYSLPFCIAAAAIKGRNVFAPMDVELLKDVAVLNLAKKVTLIADPEMSRLFPSQTPSKVRITTTHGQFEKTIDYPFGDPKNPMSFDDVAQKFLKLAAETPIQQKAVINFIKRLHDEKDARHASIKELTHLFSCFF